MLFSIIVPVYNVEKYLEECLRPIIEQITKLPDECELILIDDGSTDRSGSICDKYYALYPDIIKIFHNENQGLLLTRRFGYKHAKGEYIINCDSDDMLEGEALDILKKAIIANDKPDVIFFNHYLYDGTGKRIAYKDIFSNETQCRVSKEDVLQEFLLRHSIVGLWGKCYRRKCIETNKDYTDYRRISNGEDSLQTLEIFDYARTYVYLNIALYNYRIGSGMTKKYDPNYYISFKEVIGKIEDRKEAWNLCDFDKMVAVKALATAGRAITQSRLKQWSSFMEQKKYLETIHKDIMFKKNIVYLSDVKDYLQKDHIVLLFLLEKKYYIVDIFLLRMKNRLEHLTEVKFKNFK